MRFIRFSAFLLIAGFSLTGCGSLNQADRVQERIPNQQQQQQAVVPRDIDERTELISADENYWAKDNLDLQAVGALLEQAEDAAQFERLLNSPNSVNNLDLNGDRYADYISVREFDDYETDQRGLSLFSMFGPDLVQEIATIIFDRDRLDAPGARILLNGNDQIYGDNNFYETNWVDRSLTIADWLFRQNRGGGGDRAYQSPYYFENYPDYYEPYQIVETPVYVTRVDRFRESPVFVQTNAPVTVKQIKIKSPYNGRFIDKIYSKLAKPNKEQIEFRKNNPVPPGLAKKEKKDSREFFDKREDKPKDFEKNWKGDKDKRVFEAKNDKPGKGNDKPKEIKFEKPDFKENKGKGNKDKENRGGGNDKPNKEKGNGKGNGGGGGNGKGKKN